MERLLMKLSLWFVIVLVQTYGYKGCLEKERIGLLELKSFIKSVSNYDKDEIFISWVDDKTSNCCDWERVKCNATTRRVIELSLNSSTQLDPFGYPTLNLSLFHPFDELLSLDFSFNSFEGCQENKVYDDFGGLKQLKVLDLGFNSFNASLLPCLNTLTSLTILILPYNHMGHGLTSAKQGLENLKNLEVLELGGNQISGSLSGLGLANLTNLKTLILGFNQINFSLASQGFANVKSLEILDLRYNGINGSLSSSGICELKNLVEVNLGKNNFDGQLPQCLTNLTHLKVLVLSANQLSGYLPPFIGDMKSLEYLDLQDNNFEGLFSLSSFANHSNLEVFLLSTRNNTFQVIETKNWFPAFQLKALVLTNCKLYAIPSFLLYQYNLSYIDLSHNKLVETFPTWLLVNNTNLVEMHLANNLFSGILKLPNFKHRLATLDISHNSLSGQFPKNIGKLFPMLTLLNLSHNNFHGQIFHKDMNLTFLECMYLNNNNFSGTIGKGLLNSAALQDLDFSNNKVSGQIPFWIADLSNIQLLFMSKNLLEGNIPIQLRNSKSLLILDISENKLSGPISSFNCSSIKVLSLQTNAFTGPIPNSLFRISTLIMLNLRDNQFSGSIPNLINMDSNLRVLLLAGNDLRDHIPNQLCQLRMLTILDLSHNRLNGSIPSCFTSMISWTRENYYRSTDTFKILDYALYYSYSSFQTLSASYHSMITYSYVPVLYQQLDVEFLTKHRYDFYKGDILTFMTGLDLSNNDLTGEIPSEIGELQGIKALNLSNNSLSRSIPKSFSNLKNVESLDLSYNKLSGEIPSELMELYFLGTFNVSYNNLCGRIPNNWQFGTFDGSAYAGNPCLCGPIINKSCTNAPILPPLPTSREGGEESAVDLVAFYWSFGGSYCVVILGLLVILLINPHWRMVWFYFIDKCIDMCFYWFSKYISC